MENTYSVHSLIKKRMAVNISVYENWNDPCKQKKRTLDRVGPKNYKPRIFAHTANVIFFINKQIPYSATLIMSYIVIKQINFPLSWCLPHPQK